MVRGDRIRLRAAGLVLYVPRQERLRDQHLGKRSARRIGWHRGDDLRVFIERHLHIPHVLRVRTVDVVEELFSGVHFVVRVARSKGG